MIPARATATATNGATLGGVRTAWVDVPGALPPSLRKCSQVIGEMRLFGDDTLAATYASPSARTSAWAGAVRRMEAGGWLLPEDAAVLRARPQ